MFAERLSALRALLRLRAEGEAAIVGGYGALGQDDSAIRLRAEIIGKLYGKPFGPPAIIQLLQDTWTGSGRATTHVLYSLAKNIPIADVPAILDGVVPVTLHQGVERRSAWDVAAFYELILTRAWESDAAFDPDRAFKWLEVRRSMRGLYTGDRGERLRTAMRARPERLHTLADRLLANLVADDHSWLTLSRFREMTFYEISPDDLLDEVIHHMKATQPGGAKETFLYEPALGLCHQASEAHGHARFEELNTFADTRPELVASRIRGT